LSKKEEILGVLKRADRDLSIQEITDRTHLSRDTVSKYVGILEAEGKIEMTRKVGRAKMYYLRSVQN